MDVDIIAVEKVLIKLDIFPLIIGKFVYRVEGGERMGKIIILAS